MPRSRRNANQRYHDRVAGKYEQIYSDAYWQWHDSLTWDYMKKSLPRDLATPVVDLGCGSGKWGRKLLKSGYHVTFVDLSAKMVDEARKQIESPTELEKCEFLQADLVDLSALPSDHFGFATAMGEPLCSTENPKKAIRELARILKPEGILIATFDNRIACVDHYVERNDLSGLEQFLKTGRTHWLTRDPSEQFEMHTFTPSGVRKLMESAGLEVIELVGKTVLPMRKVRDALDEPAIRKKWEKIEQKLGRDPDNLGRCPHLQVTCRKLEV